MNKNKLFSGFSGHLQLKMISLSEKPPLLPYQSPALLENLKHLLPVMEMLHHNTTGKETQSGTNFVNENPTSTHLTSSENYSHLTSSPITILI